MRLVTVKIPELYLEGIDELVQNGRYSSRSEVIRTAIRDLLKKELWVPMNESYMGRPNGGNTQVKRVSLLPY
ncbi:MAG: CopG family transcriptional regulator [Thermoprotei archaeon]|nr:MAG: CopG family transcriptional regulator [Thermoprotei archaeon]